VDTGKKFYRKHGTLPLDADRLYLQDDESVFGHLSISFLSLYSYRKPEEMLKKAKLNHKVSTGDLLLQYSKVYQVRIGDRTLISEVPKKAMDLDSKLGLSLIPTT
jgi:hypothetical protein